MKVLRPIVFFCSLVLVLASCEPEGPAKYPKATHLYFSDYSGKKLGVVDLNSLNTFSTIADASDGLDTVSGIAVDFIGGQIYATEELNNRIVRFNIDGSGSLQVLYDMHGTDSIVYEPSAIAVDNSTGFLYWANSGNGQIRKGTLDGSGAMDILYDSVSLVTYCYGLTIDEQYKRLIYSDFGLYAGVYSMPLDESAGPSRYYYPSYALRNPSQVFYDQRSQIVYWADQTYGSLVRANLPPPALASASSLAFQVIYDDEDNIQHPNGIAVDIGSSKIYWTEPAQKLIKRANLDGTGDEEIVATGVESYSIILRFDNQ